MIGDAGRLVDRAMDDLGEAMERHGARATLSARGKSVTLGGDEMNLIASGPLGKSRTNTETGEIDYDETGRPSWEELSFAFAEEEEDARMDLDTAKEEVKRLKLRHEETKTALGRIGRRVRYARAVR